MTKIRSSSFGSRSIKSTKSSKSATLSLKQTYTEIKSNGISAFPTRYVVVLVAMFANTLSYTIRTNMSLTIVAMVNTTALSDISSSSNITQDLSNSCPVDDSNSTAEQNSGSFIWSEAIQGHILGSFYYGYIATNINGGQLADWLGVRWLCGFVIIISAVLTFLTPIVSYWSPIALIVLRVLTGLVQGILTPAIYAMLAHWVPKHERGVVLALIQVGGNFGAVIALPMSAILCKHGFSGGWPSVFYVIGLCGILCFVLWMFCIYDTPQQHPRISSDELMLIHDHVNVCGIGRAKHAKRAKPAVPWISILVSLPMWSIAVAKFCGAWGNLMLMAKLPTYLESVLHMPIEMNGIISAVVYIALSISLTFFGFLSDFIGKKKCLNETLSRKIFETIALVGPAICLALVPVIRCDMNAIIALLIVAMIIFGLNAGGDKPIVVDIAPHHSGTIYGITNAIASLPGILAPLFVGLLLNGKYGSITQWNYVFYSSSAIYIFGAIFFVAFGTAKAQPWGVIDNRSRSSTTVSTTKSKTNMPSMTKIAANQQFNANECPVFSITMHNDIHSEVDEGLSEIDDNDREFYFKERRFSIFPIP